MRLIQNVVYTSYDILYDFHVCDKLFSKREWAELKKELQEERDNVRTLTLDREKTLKNAMGHVEEMGKELSNALHATAAAEARAAISEVLSLSLYVPFY